MRIQRLWMCLLENAQAAQCVTSQLVFDRLGDQRADDCQAWGSTFDEPDEVIAADVDCVQCNVGIARPR